MDRPEHQIRGSQPAIAGVLLVSMLVMLNLTSVFTLATGMDLYGFYTIDGLASRPIPLLVSSLLHVASVGAAYASWRWLLRRESRFTGENWGPFRRGLLFASVPVAVGFAPSIVLTSATDKPTQIAVAGLLAGSLCITHALRDPESELDFQVARYMFTVAVIVMSVFVALSVSAMLVLYMNVPEPESGNLLWTWTYDWSDLGYGPEEFSDRYRDALLPFVLAGIGIMIVVPGGSMLGAILRWTHRPRQVDHRLLPADQYQDVPVWVASIAQQLRPSRPPTPGEAEFLAVFGGREMEVTGSQYQRLVADRDDLLRDVGLFVDKVAGNVLLRTGEAWTKLDFRVGDTTGGVRSGPFLLLCILARNPGRRFLNGELQTLLEQELTSRQSFNVRDFVSQLQSRRPRLPVERDDIGTFLDDSTRVCLVERR